MVYNKKWREEKDAQNICVVCGKSPQIENKKECIECRDNRRERQKKDYHGNGSKKDYHKNRRHQFKINNLCSRCVKEKTIDCLTCEICLEKQRENVKSVKDKVFEHYGGYACCCCGEKTRCFLTLDHINNDGAKHRRELGKSSSAGKGLYMWIIRNNYPPLFQVLCANCNLGKKMNNGICPHKQAEPVSRAMRPGCGSGNTASVS